MDATPQTLDIIQPAANWVLKIQEVKGEMETTIGIKSTTADITNSQSQVAKTFFLIFEG